MCTCPQTILVLGHANLTHVAWHLHAARMLLIPRFRARAGPGSTLATAMGQFDLHELNALSYQEWRETPKIDVGSANVGGSGGIEAKFPGQTIRHGTTPAREEKGANAQTQEPSLKRRKVSLALYFSFRACAGSLDSYGPDVSCIGHQTSTFLELLAMTAI